MNTNTGEKIKTIRKALKLSQIDMAKKLNVSERTLRDYEKNRFTVNYDFISKLINNFNVNSDWLFKDEGDIFTTEIKGITKADHDKDSIPGGSEDNFANVPLLEMTAGAGSGIIINEERIKSLVQFNKYWLSNVLYVSPKNVAAIIVDGDSMSPTINNGDLILVDQSKNQPKDGVYVISLNDSLLVKRIQCLPGYKLEIKSDNPVYETFIVELINEPSFKIIGKVVWFGRGVG